MKANGEAIFICYSTPKDTRFWTATCPSAGLNPNTRIAARVPHSPGDDLSNQAGTRAGAAASLWRPSSLAVAGSPVIVPMAITTRSWSNCPKTSITWGKSPAPERFGPKRVRASRIGTGGLHGRTLAPSQGPVALANPQDSRGRKGAAGGGLRAPPGLCESGADAGERTLAGAAQRCQRQNQIRVEQRSPTDSDARTGARERRALAH